jgi:hypothetical protein
MLLVGLNFSRPQIKLARQGGVFAIVVSVLIILLCILAIVLFNLSAILILPCAGLLGIFFFTYIFKPQPAREGAVK